jgi:hypothetical protein
MSNQTSNDKKPMVPKYLEEENHCPDREYSSCLMCEYYLHCMEAITYNPKL